MNVCINLQFLQNIKSGDLLTYLTLLTAYIAYVWSINRDFNFWKSILISFKKDLENQSAWLMGEYYRHTYKDKNSFSPGKIIFPLVFDSLPEIIRKGIAEIPWVSDEFIKKISLFNERISAFNSALDHIKQVCASNPIISEKVKDRLNELGLKDGSVSYLSFKKKICVLKKSEDILYLAENIHRLHTIVHVELIGNREKKDKLQFLYTEITKELDNILDNFDKKRPFFIRYFWPCIALSIIVFILIENYL